MKKCHRLSVLLLMVFGHFGFAATASARADFPLSSFTLALAGVGFKQACGDAGIIEAQSSSEFVAPPLSKAAAILGHPSKLDLIMQAQSVSTGGTAQSTQVGPAKLERTISPALPGRCRIGEWSLSGAAAMDLPSRRDAHDFLGTKRIRVTHTSFDASWNRVRKSSISRGLASGLLKSLATKTHISKLEEVNAWTNDHVRYAEDRDLYGQADYWANAGTTLARRAGDCEDIAIVKMQLLAAAGIPRSDMYLTVARDTLRNADHALLVVNVDGNNWLLDNSTNQILNATTANDYSPIFSYSSNKKWVHGISAGQFGS